VRSIDHGFRHAPDWSWVSLGCADCGYCERWEELAGAMNDHYAGSGRLTQGARATRARIERDIRQRVRDKGCPHV